MATKKRRALGGRLGISHHWSFQTRLEDEANKENLSGILREHA